MATAVEIANMALLECGAEPLTALSDTTERARACNTAWPFVRRTVLRLHTWNAPTKRALVDEDATAPIWEFATRYPLPADCLRVLEVDTTSDWRVEAGYIVTDETGDDLGIRYIFDQTDPSGFDPTLTDTLVLFLAYRIMHRLNADVALRDRIERQWMEFLKTAKMMDGEEQTDAEVEEDTWLTARL